MLQVGVERTFGRWAGVRVAGGSVQARLLGVGGDDVVGPVLCQAQRPDEKGPHHVHGQGLACVLRAVGGGGGEVVLQAVLVPRRPGDADGAAAELVEGPQSRQRCQRVAHRDPAGVRLAEVGRVLPELVAVAVGQGLDASPGEPEGQPPPGPHGGHRGGDGDAGPHATAPGAHECVRQLAVEEGPGDQLQLRAEILRERVPDEAPQHTAGVVDQRGEAPDGVAESAVEVGVPGDDQAGGDDRGVWARCRQRVRIGLGGAVTG